MAERTRTHRPDRPPRTHAGHGGRRAGAGRKPKNGVAGVAHDTRAPLVARFPAHVTMKLQPGLPRLREAPARTVLLAAFAACRERHAASFRVTHFAILDDRLHLLVEAADRPALTRGLQGLSIRIARGLNKLWAHRGTVFADRYHDRILKTPREVRQALAEVFASGRKHAAAGRGPAVPQALGAFTSAPWFDGFRERVRVRGLDSIPLPVAPPRTWLLARGWRRHGLLSVHDLPAAR